jgi:ATP-dependent Zn protease
MIKNGGIKLAGSIEENESLIKTMAKTLRGFAFIDLKKFVQNSAAIATERGHKTVHKEDMIESYLRLTTGRPNMDIIPQHEKELTTKHECGHALTLQIMNNLMHKSGKAWMVPHTVNFITLDPRAFYGGAMYNVLDTNNEQCFENAFSCIISSYGGHSAEKVLFGMDGSLGITCDLHLATSTAETMVEAMGMGYNTGKISVVNMYGDENFQRNITPRLRNKIEKDVEVITKNALLSSDMIVETYSGFINEFANKYADKVGTGDCLIDGDQFRKELAEWRAKQSPEKQAELDVLDNMLLDIIDKTKKGCLY